MNDTKAQLQAEVKMLTSEDRQDLLKSAVITIDIPPEQGLAIKADLAIPWNKLRVIRRYQYHTCIHGSFTIDGLPPGTSKSPVSTHFRSVQKK